MNAWITLICVFLTGLAMGIVIMKSDDLFQVVMIGLTMGYVSWLNIKAWKAYRAKLEDDDES